MALKRFFLGLERPALISAADYLLGRFATRVAADLRSVVVVVPGARAGRRLLELLVDRCADDGRLLTPPTVTTVGRFPELLYRAKRPFADELVQQLTWADTLRQFDRARLRTVIPQPPHNDDSARWLELGRMFQSLHRELASDVLNFEDVAKCGKQLQGFQEVDRWTCLAEIQQAYLDELDRLELWDLQTARRVAIQHQECRLDQPLVLVGAADFNRAIRQMLNQVSQHVTSLVFAPADWGERFDAHGCLVPAAWQDLHLDVPDASLLPADDPLDQADAVARRLAQWGGRYRAEQITIGLPDERLVPQLERQLDECGLPNRFGPGRSLADTAPVRLLEGLAALLESGRYRDFAALVRHADVEAWVSSRGVSPGWLRRLDDYYCEHLPLRLDGQWLGPPDAHRSIQQLHTVVQELLAPLSGPPRRLDQWIDPLSRVVHQVYGERSFELDDAAQRTTWSACLAIQDVLDRLGRIPQLVQPPATSAADAIGLLLSQASSRVAAPAEHEAIELVGWLELPLDDAPALIVTSFNEGFVPQSLDADLFLPNSLRSALGLDDNARRYARDAYALSVLLAPWRELTLVVARRDADDDPLAPSRLLFAAPPETVARRALRFFEPPRPRSPRPPLAGTLVAARQDFSFDIPRPQPLAEPIEKLSVTAFRSYLACPYRFYLNHVCRLRAVDDDVFEMDGRCFGELAHLVLQAFGQSDECHATETDRIERLLNHAMNQVVAQVYGKCPSTAVQLQVEQLRLRLTRFAAWQAGWASQGWRIEHVEVPQRGSYAEMPVDGRPFKLSGRIDRIDVHQDTGQRVIFDYKTSDNGARPQETHLCKEAWIDLQLPLYRHLARAVGIDGPFQLGYVLLPKKLDAVGQALAEWSDEQLAAADEKACEVVRAVRRQVFWPPRDPPPDYSEDLAYICLDGVFGRPRLAEATLSRD